MKRVSLVRVTIVQMPGLPLTSDARHTTYTAPARGDACQVMVMLSMPGFTSTSVGGAISATALGSDAQLARARGAGVISGSGPAPMSISRTGRVTGVELQLGLFGRSANNVHGLQGWGGAAARAASITERCHKAISAVFSP